MNSLMKFTMLLLVILFGTSYLFSQPGRGLNQSDITKLYNPTTEANVDGKISSVVIADSGFGRFPAVIINLKNDNKEVPVYMAPEWYLKDEKIELKKDQVITVTGSHVTHNNQPLLIARTMKYNDKEVIFRNSKGVPVWAGKAMGPGAGRGKRNR